MFKEYRRNHYIRKCALCGASHPSYASAVAIIATLLVAFCIFSCASGLGLLPIKPAEPFPPTYTVVYVALMILAVLVLVYVWEYFFTNNRKYRQNIAKLPHYDYLKTASVDLLQLELNDLYAKQADFKRQIRIQELEKQRANTKCTYETTGMRIDIERFRRELDTLAADTPEHIQRRKMLYDLISARLASIENAQQTSEKWQSDYSDIISRLRHQQDEANLWHEITLRQQLLRLLGCKPAPDPYAYDID